jgi:hypothetical protein
VRSRRGQKLILIREIDLLGVAKSIADILGQEETATHFAIDIPMDCSGKGSR